MTIEDILDLDDVELVDLGEVSSETYGVDWISAAEGPYSRQLL